MRMEMGHIPFKNLSLNKKINLKFYIQRIKNWSLDKTIPPGIAAPSGTVSCGLSACCAWAARSAGPSSRSLRSHGQHGCGLPGRSSSTLMGCAGECTWLVRPDALMGPNSWSDGVRCGGSNHDGISTRHAPKIWTPGQNLIKSHN